MLQWRLLHTSCSSIFFLGFPPLSGCAFVSLVLSKKPIHPAIHPPVQESTPTRRRLDPRSHFTFRREGSRRRRRRVAGTTPVRRFADVCAAWLGRNASVVEDGHGTFPACSWTPLPPGLDRWSPPAAVLQELRRPCAPQPRRLIHPPIQEIDHPKKTKGSTWILDRPLSLRCRPPSILASKLFLREAALEDARNQQTLKRRSHLSCSPRSDEGRIRALLVPLRRGRPNAGKKAAVRFHLFRLLS